MYTRAEVTISILSLSWEQTKTISTIYLGTCMYFVIISEVIILCVKPQTRYIYDEKN